MSLALGVGKFIGLMAYYFDTKHKSQAYANLKMAFADSKSPEELKQITKELFKNYGQNFIELFRMPLLTPEKFKKLVKIEGNEYITESLKEGKGVIFLAMHYGSWEMASLACAMLNYPYKVIVKEQTKHSRLNDLLNDYRACGGSVVLTRGMGTRDFVKSLKENKVIGMVADQGGRDGVLVPFFGRQASMSVGAIRMGLKLGVPLCFSVIIREKGAFHKMVIHKPLELIQTGDLEKDIVTNLNQITKVMEDYIRQHPSEYMWFYKIWKYSDETNIVILNDGKVGHLRQSENLARITQKSLAERDIKSSIQTKRVVFKSKLAARLCSVICAISHPFFLQGRLGIFKWFLTEESYKEIMSIKADFIISCGSSIAGINYLLSLDHSAKNIAILKPGLLGYNKFDLVVLPQHDTGAREEKSPKVVITKGAPNLINKEYLKDQSEKLFHRYSHLKNKTKLKIGLFIGGDAKSVYLSEQQMRILIRQVKEAAKELKADILVTTSRRTPVRIEQLFLKQLKKDSLCPLVILANREDVPEAVGGILGLADIVVTSGDSISMISEAASSGKNTIVFSPQNREVVLKVRHKHTIFINKLNQQGHILSTDVKNVGRSIFDVAKNKIQTKKIDNNEVILEAVRKVI